VTGELCLLILCIGPATAPVALSHRRSIHFQSTVTANSDSEFISQARFVHGWNFGEPQVKWFSVGSSAPVT
jgi:hypothetical protein